MSSKNQIPVYSLDNFRKTAEKNRLFQVEVFDANRHFKVSYPHRHDFHEILYLDHGTGIHIIDGNRYEINPPCIFFLSPGQAHKLELSHDIEGFIFLFKAEFYLINKSDTSRLLNFPFYFSVDQTNPPLLLKKNSDNDFLRSLFVRGCFEIQKVTFSEEIIRSVLDLILLTCEQLYPEELSMSNTGKSHILVKKFLYLIEENYQNNLRVNDYADKLAVTPNHLTQVLKQLTGKTTLQHIREKQIIEIKRFLLHSGMTVSEIAESMSFMDQSYFTKYFKNMTGMTPQEYRKKSMKIT